MLANVWREETFVSVRLVDLPNAGEHIRLNSLIATIDNYVFSPYEWKTSL